ncbi:docking protein 1 isoform X1 [Perognathus longimembris pacificus]|uniref:docking protein 1 isoform X1 n=4 Tax=Perognathus longimembris pacificus TaxID=214514 RepID=UPI00201A0FD0|nr:docking protein 1 isoform X1 [Perognathus longimembris pacificus]
MDRAVMEGPLFLQSQRFGTKRWRKTWAVLYPASPHGVARLEFFDHKGSSSGGGPGGSRRLDCKVIRLAECVSVAPVAMESPPEPGATAFRLDTAQRSHLLAADALSSAVWVQTLCRNAFPKGGWAVAQGEKPPKNPPKLSALEMLENSLYSPTWEGSQFWVTMQRTEASERCGLHGSYMLRVEAEKLTLLTLGTQSQILEPLLSWPYTLLRRYGRDKVMFSFEAGRRCPSGPGTFTFQTTQGNDIFQAVETAIQRQKAQGKAGQGHDVLRADSHEGEVAEGKLTSPSSPQELGSPPALYAEPLDSLRIPAGPPQDSLYSDPVDSTPTQAEEGVHSKKPLYWDLYEHVQQQFLKAKLTDSKEDPIYDEPEGLAPAQPRGLYDLPQELKDAWWCQARVKEEGYELPYNPATDDYAVPPPRSTKPRPAPKPQGLTFSEPGTSTSSGSKNQSVDTALYSKVQKSGASGGWDCGLSRVETDRAGVKSEGST